MTVPLLEVDGLCVTFSTRHGPVEALRGASFSVAPGEVLGLVGESGSGKSVAALATIGLLDHAGRVTGGRIRFAGRDVAGLSAADLRQMRGAAVSMVFQNPRAALNPIRPVGHQIADALRAHTVLGWTEARGRALDLLRAVRIRDPELRQDAYPHELSGGMCQRVVIAMAMACKPALILADEPTTGLDVTTQKAVMDLLSSLVRERGMALVLITHDLGLAARYCERVAVMEHGRVVETAPPAALFRRPRHPYTQRLVAASPTPTSTVASLSPGAPSAAPPPTSSQPGTLLEVHGLVKRFDTGAPAVDGVSFRIGHGESLGLVGESGSGKSTISRIVARLMDPTAGTVTFDGERISDVPARGFHRSPRRADIQIVFQDAGESLNPRFTAADSIADPLRRLTPLRGTALRDRVAECAAQVGLPVPLLHRFPHQLSGGQRARVGIARAIAARPRLLVLDEPTAALDVSVQAVVLQLLDRLRRTAGLAFLFVSHDLNVVRMLCERMVVLQHGVVVEEGWSEAVFTRPHAAYTRELIAAIPHFEPGEDAAERMPMVG